MYVNCNLNEKWIRCVQDLVVRANSFYNNIFSVDIWNFKVHRSCLLMYVNMNKTINIWFKNHSDIFRFEIFFEYWCERFHKFVTSVVWPIFGHDGTEKLKNWKTVSFRAETKPWKMGWEMMEEKGIERDTSCWVTGRWNWKHNVDLICETNVITNALHVA